MEFKTIEELEAVLGRMREVAGVDSDSALARLLNVTPSSVSNMKKRLVISGDNILEVSLKYKVGLDYLIYGEKRKDEELRELFELAREYPEGIKFLLQLIRKKNDNESG